VGRLDSETLESFYAMLRKCREHSGGRKYVEHRKAREHRRIRQMPAARV